MALRSLRSRLLVASLLWTGGLLAIAHLASMVVVHHFPVLIRIDHRVMVLIALPLIALGVWQLAVSVSLVDRLRGRLNDVRDGSAQRVEGRYPSEVQPLVDDLNALLAHRELVVRRAIAKAGDLAHGLKTPLAILAQEADAAAAAGQSALADAIAQQVERMRRQIDYHLAHARAAASGATPGARCAILPAAEGLARTLLRLHAEKGLRIDVEVPPEQTARVEKEDLEEMLGNLLDNACKWARGRVIISASSAGPSVVVTVDDDGPGLEPSMRQRVLQRGVRADEAAPGSGFGLAIVRDLAELYSGSIELEDSPLGGLRATLTLPATNAQGETSG
jgi:signal transduction histidine kinase